MSKSDFSAQILKVANSHLQNKTVAAVRFMTPAEARAQMWSKRAPVIQFTDGTLLIMQSDDEGNDAGAASIQPADPKVESVLIPTIR